MFSLVRSRLLWVTLVSKNDASPLKSVSERLWSAKFLMCYLSEGAGTGQNQGVVSAHDRPLLDGTLHCPKPMRTSIWGACDPRKEDGIGLKSIFKNLFGCIKLKEMRQRRRTEDFRLEKPSFSLRWLPEESCVWISRRLTSWEVKTATRKKKVPICCLFH